MESLEEIVKLSDTFSGIRFTEKFSCYRSILLTLYTSKHKYGKKTVTNRELYQIILENSSRDFRKHTIRARLYEMEQNQEIQRSIEGATLTNKGEKKAIEILSRLTS